jgi:hypothetical protein
VLQVNVTLSIHAMKVYRGSGDTVPLTLDFGPRRSASRHGRFIPGRSLRYLLNRKLGGSGSGLYLFFLGVEISDLNLAGFEPVISLPA